MSICHFCIMGRGIDWALEDVAQLRDWLHESCRPCEMHAQRPDWSLECITSKLKQVRRVASDQSRPVQRRRTCEVVAEIGTAVNEQQSAKLLECRAQRCRGRFMTISKRDASSPCVRPDCRRSTQSATFERWKTRVLPHCRARLGTDTSSHVPA